MSDNVVAFIRPEPKPDSWRETRRRILERQCECARQVHSPGVRVSDVAASTEQAP